MPVSTFSMLIIAAPRIFVKGAVFFCPAYNGVLVVSVQNLVLSPKVCYTSNAAEKRQGADPNAGGCSLPVPECRAGQIFS